MDAPMMEHCLHTWGPGSLPCAMYPVWHFHAVQTKLVTLPQQSQAKEQA